ncbi:hypothetical protein E3N88_21712 [Mikania micrantha]|uniref:Uncharacterized protein n=1 Tax=Mikania micrantha TaxID=192012 RepID=A0A5N6N8D1_9ASTR|nr:hypothetical protein E3N88_21712 [Mikania micrantha]
MASPASGVKPQKFEPEIVQKALVNMVIMDGLPFSVVSQDEIKNIMETEFPDFQFPSSEKISRICTQLFMDEKLNEKRFFKALELSWNYTTYWGNVEDSNMLIYIASILDPRKKTDCMELYFLNGKYKHDYNDEGEPLWKKKAEFVVAATYDLFNVYAGKIGASHQTANFQTSGYMSYLYHDTGPRGLFQKREGAEKKERRFAFAGNHIHMKTMGLVMPQQSIANCRLCLMPIYAYSLGAATRTWFTYTVVRKHNFDQGAIKERAKSIQFDFAGNKRGVSGHATNEVGYEDQMQHIVDAKTGGIRLTISPNNQLTLVIIRIMYMVNQKDVISSRSNEKVGTGELGKVVTLYGDSVHVVESNLDQNSAATEIKSFVDETLMFCKASLSTKREVVIWTRGSPLRALLVVSAVVYLNM